jgi:methyltransferase
MIVSRQWYLVLLAALIAERLLELWLSDRNGRRALAHGGVEVGRVQYRIMIAFHTLFLVACVTEALLRNPSISPVLTIAALAGEAVAQVLRFWSIAALGEAWNTRIIVNDLMPVQTSGPYRYVRHPNYFAVVLEIACIPLIRGLVITAVVFSIGNAIILAFRIPLEERALGDSYRRAFASVPRFVPRLVGR